MELSAARNMGGAKLASIAGICVAVFGIALAIAAVGYSEWMWVFVFAGLVVPPVVLTLAVGAALLARVRRSGSVV